MLRQLASMLPFSLHRRKRAIALVLSSVLAFSLSLGVEAISPSSLGGEIRGAWITNVDSEVLFSSQGTREAVLRLASFNFNTLYPTVWQSGYTLYPSAIARDVVGASVDPEPGLQNRDMLAEIIREGHAQNFTVIPWFEFGFMAPADSELAKRHPDWLTSRKDGSTVQLKGIHPVVWLNPFHPEVQDFLLDLIVEVVSNYDVDGIQFDDHFSLPVDFGYDDYTRDRFERDWQGGQGDESLKAYHWRRWRSHQLTQFVRRLSDTVREIKPNCTISVSPNPFGFALSNHVQDWVTWVEEGLIDEIVLQVYRDNMDSFISELERPELQLIREYVPVAIGILSGLKNRPTPIDIIAEQVRATRDRGYAGVSFFFYESLWKWADEPYEVRNSVLYDLFSTPTARTATP